MSSDVISIYIGGHDPVILSNTIAMVKGLGISAIPVLSPRISPGWKGCRECHRLMAKQALKDGKNTYITMEQNVIPTLKYDKQTILDAFHFVDSGKAPLVNLSCSPVPGSLRYPIHKSIMGKLGRQCDLTQCLVLRQGVIKEALKINEHIDVALTNLGFMKYVVYPTPFQRNISPSLASPEFNHFLGKSLRNFSFRPHNYSRLECFLQYELFIVIILIIISLIEIFKYIKI